MASSGSDDVAKGSSERNPNGGGGCGRDCLSECCLLQGAKLPLYSFSKTANGLHLLSEKNEPQLSFLNKLLERWEEKNRSGLFHQDIATCDIKMLPGEYGFIVRLVEGRDKKKRPTEFTVDKVLQPFDEEKFNFTKIAKAEVICRFEESENNMSKYLDAAPIRLPELLNIIAINVYRAVTEVIIFFIHCGTTHQISWTLQVSPIAYGHVLLIPRILELLPQRMDRDSLLLSLYLAKEASSHCFKIAYNSLGAFATINHLHFQSFHLPMLLPAEKASTESIATLKSGVKILRLLSYPVRGFVYEGGTSLVDLSDAVSSTCTFLQNNNHPYNILISDSGKRIFVFPQCYAERRALGTVSQAILDTQVNPAAWEISGYLVLKKMNDYEEASQGKICEFFKEVSWSEERFQALQGSVLQALQGITEH